MRRNVQYKSKDFSSIGLSGIYTVLPLLLGYTPYQNEQEKEEPDASLHDLENEICQGTETSSPMENDFCNEEDSRYEGKCENQVFGSINMKVLD